MKIVCSIVAIALAGLTTCASSINRRQDTACSSGEVHFDAWVIVASSCGDDGAEPSLVLDVPIGNPCFAVPAELPLRIPFYAAVNYVGSGYNVSIYLDAECSQSLASLPDNYQLGGCESVESPLGIIQIVGSCLAGDRDDEDAVASESMPMANEEAAEECCACIPEEISNIPIASDDAMMTGMPTDNTVMVRRQGGPDFGIPEIGECCPCDSEDIPLAGETGIFEDGLADAVSDVATDLLDDSSDVPDAITDAVDQIEVAAEKLG